MSEVAVVRKNSGVTDLLDSKKFAEVCIQSGLFKDTTDLAKALLKISYGRALGVDEATSMQSINVIQGKLSLSANLIAVRIKQSGRYRYEVLKKTDKECQIQFYEKIEDYLPDGRVTNKWIKPGPPEVFTVEMAKRANLTRNPVWGSHPEAMCFNRAISSGAKTYAPDVFAGMPIYTADELDPDLPIRVVDGEVVVDAHTVDAPPSEKAVALVASTVNRKSVSTEVPVAPTLEMLKTLVAETGSDLQNLLKVAEVKSESELSPEQIRFLWETLNKKKKATLK